jgi:simple sugar transport system permease protein
MMEQIITGMIASSIAAGALIVIAGMGELMLQRTGVYNLSLEGMISMGAITAIIVVSIIPNVYVGVVGAAFVGVLMAFFFALSAVTIKVDQYMAGLALWFVGVGLSGELGKSYTGQIAQVQFSPIKIPFLSDIPIIGQGIFNQSVLVYVAYFILPALAYYVLFKTRHGLNLRSVGQNPLVSDGCGIPVDTIRFFYTLIGGALCGVAGAYLTLSLTPGWANGVVAGRGWIAFALVIFANWNPLYIVLGALLFGAATSIGFAVQIQGWNIPSSFLFMLPYLTTLVLMFLSNLIRRQRGIDATGIGPAALGTPFYRE